MNKTRLFLTALAVAISAPAFAADLGRSVIRGPAPPAPFIDWTGFYLGAHAGFGWANADYRFNTAGHYNFLPGNTFSHAMAGVLAGGHVGYNWMWNNFVLGIEGAGTWSGMGRTAASPFFPADTIRTQLDWFGTITPRAGIAFGNTMLYAKGGLAFGEVTSRLQDPLSYVERSETRAGWTIGAGLDWMLTPNWIVGVEGNYYDFGQVNVSESARLLGTNVVLPGASTNHDVSVAMGSVLGRVTYKFGSREPIMARY